LQYPISSCAICGGRPHTGRPHNHIQEKQEGDKVVVAAAAAVVVTVMVVVMVYSEQAQRPRRTLSATMIRHAALGVQTAGQATALEFRT